MGNPFDNLDFLLEQHIVNHNDSHKRVPGIHASEISMCGRRAVYTMTGTEKKHNIALKMAKKFAIGHKVHSMIQGWCHGVAQHQFQGYDVTFRDEVPISPDLGGIAAAYNIHSSCDGMFVLARDGRVEHKLLIEIKSENPSSFEKLTKPKPEHIEQGHVYMMCLDVNQIWFIYYNKGNEEMTPCRAPWVVNFDRNIWRTLTDRFDGWNVLIAEGKLPEREEGFICSFCPYTWTCRPKTSNGRPTRR